MTPASPDGVRPRVRRSADDTTAPVPYGLVRKWSQLPPLDADVLDALVTAFPESLTTPQVHEELGRSHSVLAIREATERLLDAGLIERTAERKQHLLATEHALALALTEVTA